VSESRVPKSYGLSSTHQNKTCHLHKFGISAHTHTHHFIGCIPLYIKWLSHHCWWNNQPSCQKSPDLVVDLDLSSWLLLLLLLLLLLQIFTGLPFLVHVWDLAIIIIPLTSNTDHKPWFCGGTHVCNHGMRVFHMGMGLSSLKSAMESPEVRPHTLRTSTCRYEVALPRRCRVINPFVTKGISSINPRYIAVWSRFSYLLSDGRLDGFTSVPGQWQFLRWRSFST
jgi:hypothetical protein